MTGPRIRVDTRVPVPEIKPREVRYPRQLERAREPAVVDTDDPRPGVPPRRRRLPSWSRENDWTA
jgi:hypothetical protein